MSNIVKLTDEQAQMLADALGVKLRLSNCSKIILSKTPFDKAKTSLAVTRNLEALMQVGLVIYDVARGALYVPKSARAQLALHIAERTPNVEILYAVDTNGKAAKIVKCYVYGKKPSKHGGFVWKNAVLDDLQTLTIAGLAYAKTPEGAVNNMRATRKDFADSLTKRAKEVYAIVRKLDKLKASLQKGGSDA